MNNSKTSVWRGQPQPLGANWDGEGVNFALFSERADRVELCLFDSKTRRETERIAMRWQTNQVWHCSAILNRTRLNEGMDHGKENLGLSDF
jgi:isoamylase